MENIKSSIALSLMLLACPMALAEGVEAELPITCGSALTDGYIYTVSRNATIISDGMQDGLIVANRATVTLYIPKDVTLTIAGNGRFCGICVPENATLIITGEGTLEVQGGYATTGYYGSFGRDAAISNNVRYAGKGGSGGSGGQGAGAAIGGRGGQGGDYTLCPASTTSLPISNTTSVAVAKGANGKNGANGQNMGTVYVMGTVKLKAVNGSMMAISADEGGPGKNASLTLASGMKYFVGGGGAGGRGGSGSISTYAIGGGGYGGGSGGSGAYGGYAFSSSSSADYNCIGSNGGNGQGSQPDEKQTTEKKTGAQTAMMTGGAGSTGGVAGNAGANGTLFQMTATYNKPSMEIDGKRIPVHTTTYPGQVIATFSLDNNGGSGDEISYAYYGVRMENVSVPVLHDKRFMGYYDAEEGGHQVYDCYGAPTSTVSTYAHNATLYAHWKGYSIGGLAELIDYLIHPSTDNLQLYDYNNDGNVNLDDVATLRLLILKK